MLRLKLPLPVWLGLCAFVATLAVAVLLGWRLTDRIDAKLIEDRHRILQTQARAIETHFQWLDGNAQATIGQVADALNRGEAGPDRPSDTARLWALLLQGQPSIVTLAVGFADDRYVGAWRDPDDATQIRFAVIDTAELVAVSDEEAGVPGNLPLRVTERGWYEAAIQAGGRPVVEAYFDRARAAPMIRVARSVDAPGTPVAIAEYSTATLGQMLASIPGGEREAVFLATSDGLVLADRNASGISTRPVISDQHRLTGALGDEIRVGPGQVGSVVRLNEEDQWLELEAVRGPGGVDLVLGLVRPASPLPERTALWIPAALAAVLIALLAAWIGGCIRRPLGRLKQAIQALREGRMNEPLPDSVIAEFDELAEEFTAMREKIRQRIERLEVQVRDRADALEEARRRLDELNLVDEMTGVANRRRFAGELAREWQTAMRHQRPLSLVVADVDWLQSYNAKMGESAGDEVLRRVAATLAAGAKRAGDVVARIGGEEFAVLLPDTTPAQAHKLAERLRAAVASMAIEHPVSKHGHVTISCGVATMVPEQRHGMAGPMELMKKADRAMLKAKQAGRDRVVVAGPVDLLKST
ncbi:MAG: hypothetical protein Kow0020_01870 [Wenzhouxiangellaceae bacterium]